MEATWLDLAALAIAILPRAALAQSAEAAPDAIEPASSELPADRLRRALFERIAPDGSAHGLLDLDPPLWSGSTYLLAPPRHAQAIAALESFLDEPGERDLRDPLARAMLQRELWAVFDWLAARTGDDAERESLLSLLCRAMRRVALASEELAALADAQRAASNAPSLPPELFARDGAWIALDAEPAGDPLARHHAHALAGREVIAIFLRTPNGRDEALAYLDALRAVPMVVPCAEPCPRWPPDAGVGEHGHFSSELPQPPPGTTFALARRMMVLDPAGEPWPTPVLLSLQTRELLDASAPADQERFDPHAWRPAQRTAELELSRARLLAGDADPFRSTADARPHLPRLFTHGGDPFEGDAEGFALAARDHPDRCLQCHDAPGILSANSVTGVMSGAGTHELVPITSTPRRVRVAELAEIEARAADWKREQDDWRLLRELWSR